MPGKHFVVINGRKTSVSIGDVFWKGAKELAISRLTTLTDLISTIDRRRGDSNLSSAIRVEVMTYFSGVTGRKPMASLWRRRKYVPKDSKRGPVPQACPQ
ncbi:MAG: aryl-sulfate sulfotransferase [Rhizobiales bacterium]|nr:aryl-sulfate sulfotransferase [Hyphomicrobiales bacterium]